MSRLAGAGEVGTAPARAGGAGEAGAAPLGHAVSGGPTTLRTNAVLPEHPLSSGALSSPRPAPPATTALACCCSASPAPVLASAARHGLSGWAAVLPPAGRSGPLDEDRRRRPRAGPRRKVRLGRLEEAGGGHRRRCGRLRGARAAGGAVKTPVVEEEMLDMLGLLRVLEYITHTHTRTHARTHARTRARAHTHTHTHTHTH
jgi:hypothetical protein